MNPDSPYQPQPVSVPESFGTDGPPPVPAAVPRSSGAGTWGLALHLSQLANFLVPLAGIIAPIVIWQVKKGDLPVIDAHGKAVVNWMLSAIIYSALCFVLVFVLVGIPMLMVLGLLAIIFPIIGAVKASNGEVWKYPLSIPFFK